MLNELTISTQNSTLFRPTHTHTHTHKVPKLDLTPSVRILHTFALYIAPILPPPAADWFSLPPSLFPWWDRPTATEDVIAAFWRALRPAAPRSLHLSRPYLASSPPLASFLPPSAAVLCHSCTPAPSLSIFGTWWIILKRILDIIFFLFRSWISNKIVSSCMCWDCWASKLWRGVPKWAGRRNQMMTTLSHDIKLQIFEIFRTEEFTSGQMSNG